MDEKKQLGEQWVSTQEIYDGRILHVLKDTVQLPDGKQSIREVIRHVGAVCVIPVDDRGMVTVERQYRYPYDEVITEIPAGKLNDKSEDSLEAAKRELREETGLTADNWTELGRFYPAAAYSDERITMYLATGLHQGQRELDEGEFLNVYQVPLTELVKQVMAGEIPDSKTQTAILKAAFLLHHGA